MPSTSRPASVMRSANCFTGIFRSTYSSNHEMGTSIFFLSPSLHSLQKTHIVCIEVADIVDAAFEQRNTLWTHAESEPAEFGRIIPPVLQYNRVNHACTQDF